MTMTRNLSDWGSNGWAVKAGEGQEITLPGAHRPEILVRGADVDSAMGVFVFHHDVIRENPPHAHHGFMKIAYVLAGEYDFRVGATTFHGSPGTCVVVPRGSYHTFTTHTGGRLLFVSSPAGNEEFFIEMGRLGPNPTTIELDELTERFETTSLPGADGRPWRNLLDD
jgi:quercetin dioxygenase-like cupin family protein